MDVIRHQMPLLDAAFLAARKIVKHLAQMPSDEIGMDRADNHYPTMTIGAIQGAGRRSQGNTIDIETGVIHCGCVRG